MHHRYVEFAGLENVGLEIQDLDTEGHLRT